MHQSKYNNEENLMKSFSSLNVGEYIKNAYTDQGLYTIDKIKIMINEV